MSVPFPAPYGNPGYSSTPMQMPQQSLIQSLNLAQSQANQNQYLINQLRPCPTPAYITCNPWATNGASYNGCQNFCG